MRPPVTAPIPNPYSQYEALASSALMNNAIPAKALRRTNMALDTIPSPPLVKDAT
jgi:hypothetical protein